METVLEEFTRSLSEKFSEAHKEYALKLVSKLQKRNELIVDFNGLQASIDPAPDLAAVGSVEMEVKVCRTTSNKIIHMHIHIYMHVFIIL